MFLIDTSRDGKPVYDPIVNQSLDNYLINDKKILGHGFMMYINRPSVIIGVNQNAFAEVNMTYLREHGVELVRRTSGGGAVYHDMGNLVFENIVVGDPGDRSQWADYEGFANPVLTALHEMGATAATLRPHSDLVINQHKFTGMTMVKSGDAYAAGGTLMYDMNIEAASQALHPSEQRIVGKWVDSNRSEIENLRGYLAPEYQQLDSDGFREAFLKHLFHVDRLADIETVRLTDEDWAIIDQRLADKYQTVDWNYGQNPGFNRYREIDVAAGRLGVNLMVSDDVITRAVVYSDFGSEKIAAKLEKALTGTRLTADDLREALGKRWLKKVLDDSDRSAFMTALLIPKQ
ncbi:lipoate--protein ligase [Secundilactobacillus kimchicus]|uniref:lipoate--protein ligase n=1 Tax=Secundilactobacillus kimchicus TaxID=528209 RepID=UPI0024A9B177|nr:lipoate protein ligase C-terminal domain-containing protein [Secundilactobacillus kimchicus]